MIRENQRIRWSEKGEKKRGGQIFFRFFYSNFVFSVT